MKLAIKRLPHCIGDLSYARHGDSGFDLRTTATTTIEPGQTRAMSTGWCFGIPTGYELQIRPRSGLSYLGIRASLGTVDSGYIGEVKVTLYNATKHPLNVVKGERIAQAVLCPVVKAEFVEVEDLAPTDRGSDGFGSTGRY